MAAFQDTDSALTSCPPFLSVLEPSAFFESSSLFTSCASIRNRDIVHSDFSHHIFAGSRVIAGISSHESGYTAQFAPMCLDRWDQQPLVGRAVLVNVKVGDDLVFRLLQLDKVSKLIRLSCFAFTNDLCVRLE